ncbi:5637_t:CDS:2 [Funneliformis geosporum]|uniref:5637_t:CDS:1 n=1 Tax=Funneliformis geosporum TaxID=1117311 RepID=A0A9W4SRN5_9GLOM|nr:5637_t:CDS:2 [Funneliformis geosporum]
MFFRVESFTPAGRTGHSSVFIGNKLYFFGGGKNEKSYSGICFRNCWGTTVAVNYNNNDMTIFHIGGYMLDHNNKNVLISLVQTFNPLSGQWNAPRITGVEPLRRVNIQAIADDIGKIYVFGGVSSGTESEFFDDIIILNVNDLMWSYGSIANPAFNRVLYTATLLSNGMIAYIGGVEETTDNIQKGGLEGTDTLQKKFYGFDTKSQRSKSQRIIIPKS